MLIGGLAFLCLILLALLALQLTAAEAGPAVPTFQAAAPVDPPEAAELPETAELPFAAQTRVSLQDAYDEPILAELVTFLDAVHVRLGEHGEPLPSGLLPYFLDLVQRMNAEHEAYHATVFAPSPALADRRADRLRLLFSDAGLAPDLLTLIGHKGSDGVVVERS